ncbi:17046_t:CDS:2, partial [Dentiscutata heterogama]
MLISPYLFYSDYFTNYLQKTVKLMIPLLNFATYPKDYSYFELFHVSDNSFTSLYSSYYYKWWNIKALINFKHYGFSLCHSLHLLLRPTSEYSYDQPSNTDDFNNSWNLVLTYKFISSNGTIGESSLIETPDDNTNLFAMFSTSILA